MIALQILEWALLGTATLLFSATEVFDSTTFIALGCLGVAWAVRIWRTRRFFLHTGLEAAGLLFLVSAGLAARASYLPDASYLQFSRYLAAAALFGSLSTSSVTFARLVAGGLAGLGAALAIYWPLQHNYLAQPVKYGVLNRLGRGFQAIMPDLDLSTYTGASIHPNVAAGAMALLLPIALGLAVELLSKPGERTSDQRTSRFFQQVVGWLAVTSAAVMLGGVILTASRGAWMGLAGAAGLLVLAGLQRRFFSRHRWVFWGGVLVTCLLGLAAVTGLGALPSLLGRLPDPSGALLSRPMIWQQGLSLLGDYPFTGTGLMSFWMNHSTYALLIHAPFLAHSHNLFLEIGIEQGVLGLIALAGLLFGCAWRAVQLAAQVKLQPLAVAGMTALVVLCIHGLVDVVFTIERTLPLVGLAMGFAFWLAGDQTATAPVASRRSTWTSSEAIWMMITGAVVIVVQIGIVLSGSLPRLAGAWYANLGALEQARVELTAYDPDQFDSPTLDTLRRQIDLSGAEAQLSMALSLDPTNETARQRLAMLALSQARYDEAWELLAPLVTAAGSDTGQPGRRDPVTSLLVGDALVAQDQPRQAAETVRGLNWAAERLLFQAWYRYWQDGDYQRAALACEAVLLLQPKNEEAHFLLERARTRLAP